MVPTLALILDLSRLAKAKLRTKSSRETPSFNAASIPTSSAAKASIADDDDEDEDDLDEDVEDAGKMEGGGTGVPESLVGSKSGCGAGVGILEKSRAANGSI